MERKIDKARSILVYVVIATLPVMSIINVFGKVKINMALSDAFAALIILLTIIEYKKFSLKRNFPYWWYFAGLIGLMIISNMIAYINPDIVTGSILSAVNELIKFVIAGVYFFIGHNCIDDRAKFTKVLRVWAYTALAVSVIGIVMIFTNNQLRLIGTLTDPNLAATYLGVSFYISLLFISVTTGKSDRYIGIALLIIAATAIMLTQSRSGVIAFTISLLLYCLINIKRLYRYITIILLIAFIGYFGVLNLDAVYFNKQLTSSMDKRMEEVFEGKGEANRREFLAKAAYLMGKDHILTGVGRGNYLYNNDNYFEKLGIDVNSDYYKDYLKTFIPHNTYMTFFAELGILGLILFLLLFYKVIKQNFRLNYPNILILCIIGFFLVQAIAVNLENFRGIWFVLGVALLYGKKSDISESVLDYKLPGISTKKILVLNFVLFILSIYVYLNAVPYYTNPVTIDKELLAQDITNFEPNEQYIFRYLIKTETKDMSKPSSKISIYGVDKDNKETLLNQITHYAPNGYGNLVFIPNGNTSTLRIKIEPINKSDTKVSISNALVINTRTGEEQKIFTDFKYIPDSIEHNIISIGPIKDITEVDITSLNLFANEVIDNGTAKDNTGKDSTIHFTGSEEINLSDKILFLGAKIDLMETGQAKIMFKFKCLEKMDVDYSMWMHGATIDKGILPEKLKGFGFDNWDHPLNTKTSNWQVGSIYENEYIISTNPGQYCINFGLWNYNWKDGNTYRLSPTIELGCVQIK